MHRMVVKVSPQEAAQIGLLVKAARVKAGWTLQAIAGPSDVNYSQLSRIERGAFKTVSRNVQKICTFLKVSSKGENTIEPLQVDIAQRAARVAVQSSKNRRVLEAILVALDEGPAPATESPIQ